MKNYIAYSEKETKRINGGRNITLSIYRILKNKPCFIWRVKYCTASTPWAESEVFQELINKKEIPKKAMQESVTSWRGSGYYTNESKYCRITIL